jgi:hypothetical protein
MARGKSLHIGLNKVDPTQYAGWDGALTACEFDANDMKAIADSRGFDSNILLTSEATSDAVIAEIERAAEELEPGDMFVVTYSGHGGQVPDKDDGDEPDRSDETWVAFDREIVDDELYALWAKFKPGVRILVLSDSCHSGSVTRRMDDSDRVPNPVATKESAEAQSPRFRAMPLDVQIATYRDHIDLYDGIQKATPDTDDADVDATVLLISGCRDDQLSLDGFSNGLFTENLLGVWDKGEWSGGGYSEFHEAIRSRMPEDQQPVYSRVGAESPDFEQQGPFTVD